MTPLVGCSYHETLEKDYQLISGSQVLMKTVQTDYTSSVDPNFPYATQPAGMNVVPIRVTTTWPNGKVKKIEKDYDTGFTFGAYGNQYSATYGNVVAEREYNYGTGSPGALLRETFTNYLAPQNTNYLGDNNLLNLVSSQQVCSPPLQGETGNCGPSSTLVQRALKQNTYDQALSCTTGGSSPCSSGITTQHDASPPSGTYRGNLTTASRWLNTNSSYLNTTHAYFNTGMVQKTIDPVGNIIAYAYSSNYAGAFLTQTTYPSTSSPNAASHTTSATYDFGAGLISSATDENSQTTSYTYDPMFRVTQITQPSGGSVINFTYNDTPGSLSVERAQLLSGDNYATQYHLFDGLGREISKSIFNDENGGWDKTDTCYDPRGLVGFSSYPYQATTYNAAKVCSGLGDTNTYDGLQRISSVTHSDGSSKSYSYAGAASSVIDEGNGTRGVQHISQVDGLSRLVSACEVTSTTLAVGVDNAPAACGLDVSGTGFLTSYGYNALNNLVSVVQGSGLSPRSFAYDSLSRLLSTTNPESGTTSYTYDADGNVLQRTRPQPNQTGTLTLLTTMTYDALNRLRTESYSDGATPPVTINYDESSAFGTTLSNTNGRKSSEYTGTSSSRATSSIFSYDNLGRVLDNSQCTPQNCATSLFPVGYTYDNAGDLLTASNGMGTTLTYNYNRAQRVVGLASSLSDTNHPGTLVDSAHYNAFGSPIQVTLGDAVKETYGYTARGWEQSLSAADSPATPGTGSVAVSGVEQSTSSPGTGSLTISGTELSKTTCLKNGQGGITCNTVYDSGTVTLTVGGVADKASYGQGSTATSIASALAAAINSDPNAVVTVTASGATLSMVSKALGPGGNYSYSVTSSVTYSGNNSGPDFTGPASGSLTGGANGVAFDTGTISVTVGTAQATISYGQSSTAASLASQLASALNGSEVTATADGDTIYFTSVASGSGSNYSLSATSQSNNSTTFTTPSFAPATSGSTLTGGAAAGTDSGTTIYGHSITNPNTGQMGYSGNGSLQYAADSVNGTWSYVYDDFNRLITSTCTANCPQNPSGLGFTYVYDRYGNRWEQNLTAGTGGQPQYSFMSSNNRITASGVVYDSAGNVWKDGLGDTFSYDGENRISSVNTGASVYVYDAEGLRVRKTTGGATVDYIFDLSGHQVAEVSSSGSWNRGEVYAGGRHLATYSGGASGTTYFPYTDWLGTERARATVGGAVCESISSLPYGDGQVTSGSCGDPSPMHFTGKQRDTETGLDDFGARYYSSTQGRWYSPDWASAQVPVPYADLSNPQTLNLYDYVGGDPTNHADADGHQVSRAGKDGQTGTQVENGGCDVGADQSTCAGAAKPQTPAQNQSNAMNYAKGGGKIALGVGLVATTAFGDVPGGVAGALIVTSAILGGTTTAVSGVADVVGTATKTDVSKGQEALEATSNLPGPE